MAHGSGGSESALLTREIFGKRFANDTLDRLEDAAVLALPASDGRPRDVPGGERRVVVSTDSFVVTPLEFAGGDIGKLAVYGTVNDVLMMGGEPGYLTCGFILEEGLEIATLDRIVSSMAVAAASAGVTIVAGDTKVVERRAGSEAAPGMFINTTGIGFLRERVARGAVVAPSAASARRGDVVMVSGSIGDHHACILSARLGVENAIKSDCAALDDVVDALYGAKPGRGDRGRAHPPARVQGQAPRETNEPKDGVEVHVMRDVTRGGLATVLNEIAEASGVLIELDEESIPVTEEVRAFCGVMGLDPLYMGNEGKMVVIVRDEDAPEALAAMRKTEHGRDARIIGRVGNTGDSGLVIKTRIGGTRRAASLRGEGLPRIC
ncbi:MAG: hydrogenase expression/formation protein HypE [Clostridiales Family XIII bacterium]|jgi:hydrogenase expression/formation protein HypE|nr:hydrogenase expression/formation protein HypE [Clostridiales Family XIII bacterium]